MTLGEAQALTGWVVNYHSPATRKKVEAGVIVGVTDRMVQVQYGDEVHETHPSNLKPVRQSQ